MLLRFFKKHCKLADFGTADKILERVLALHNEEQDVTCSVIENREQMKEILASCVLSEINYTQYQNNKEIKGIDRTSIKNEIARVLFEKSKNFLTRYVTYGVNPGSYRGVPQGETDAAGCREHYDERLSLYKNGVPSSALGIGYNKKTQQRLMDDEEYQTIVSANFPPSLFLCRDMLRATIIEAVHSLGYPKLLTHCLWYEKGLTQEQLMFALKELVEPGLRPDSLRELLTLSGGGLVKIIGEYCVDATPAARSGLR